MKFADISTSYHIIYFYIFILFFGISEGGRTVCRRQALKGKPAQGAK